MFVMHVLVCPAGVASQIASIFRYTPVGIPDRELVEHLNMCSNRFRQIILKVFAIFTTVGLCIIVHAGLVRNPETVLNRAYSQHDAATNWVIEPSRAGHMAHGTPQERRSRRLAEL